MFEVLVKEKKMLAFSVGRFGRKGEKVDRKRKRCLSIMRNLRNWQTNYRRR